MRPDFPPVVSGGNHQHPHETYPNDPRFSFAETRCEAQLSEIQDLNNRMQEVKATMIDQITALQERKRLDYLSVAQLKQEVTSRTEKRIYSSLSAGL